MQMVLTLIKGLNCQCWRCWSPHAVMSALECCEM